MRELTEHKTNPANLSLFVEVLDTPSFGNACHHYLVSYEVGDRMVEQAIKFQKGPIKEYGVNGLTHEALLVILIDRLRSFQAGPFACRENAIALTHLEESLMWLQKRTRDRLSRGVEGTNQQ